MDGMTEAGSWWAVAAGATGIGLDRGQPTVVLVLHAYRMEPEHGRPEDVEPLVLAFHPTDETMALFQAALEKTVQAMSQSN